MAREANSDIAERLVLALISRMASGGRDLRRMASDLVEAYRMTCRAVQEMENEKHHGQWVPDRAPVPDKPKRAKPYRPSRMAQLEGPRVQKALTDGKRSGRP